MGVYFLGDLKRPVKAQLECLFCDWLFKEKQELNVHYFTVHQDAFSEDELIMMSCQRASLEQKLKKSPVPDTDQ